MSWKDLALTLLGGDGYRRGAGGFLPQGFLDSRLALDLLNIGQAGTPQQRGEVRRRTRQLQDLVMQRRQEPPERHVLSVGDLFKDGPKGILETDTRDVPVEPDGTRLAVVFFTILGM